jgi:5-aminopentanamidase
LKKGVAACYIEILTAGGFHASRYPESASSLIAPDGKCLTHAKYGEAGVFVYDIDLNAATGLLTKRFKKNVV